MFKNIARKQHGVTLIEFVVAFAILSVILTAVVTFSRSSISINRNMVNEANGVNQLKNAFNYVSRDTQMAGMVTPTDPTNTNSNHFPLTLRWITYPTDLTTVLYTIDSSGTLVRTESLNGALRGTMTIATNVNLDPAQTNCVWDSVNNKLTINIAISKGTTTEVRQFVLTPRVIQSSILNQVATTVTINSSSPNSTYNDTVTFTATVLPNVATGLVTFLDNGTPLLPTPTIALSPLGIATYTVSNLSVGSHIITAVYSGDPNYSQNTSSALPQTVNPKALTVTATGPGKVYGTALTAGTSATNFTVSGTISGETVTGVTMAPDAAGLSAATAAGAAYSVVPSLAMGTGGFLASNYNITYTVYHGTVSKAALTITANNQSKTYNQTVTFGSGSTQFTSGGLQNGETIGSVTLAVSGNGGAATAAVGSYTITPSAATSGTFNAANYTITYSTGTLTVSMAALTITANNQTKTYGQTVTFGSGSSQFTSSGLQNGETIGSVTLVCSGGAVNAAVSSSPYTITPSAATGGTFTAANYTITYNTGTLTVNKAALSITANAQSKVYGATVTFGSGSTLFTPSGLQNSETVGTVTLAVSGSGGTATAAVGSYTITPSAAIGGTFTAANYTITYNTGTLTVNKIALTLTANSTSKTYGQTVTFTGIEFTAIGLINGDTIDSVTLTSSGAVATAAVSGSPYSIIPSAAAGVDAGNYTITYVNGTLTVNKAALSITANAQSKVYGATVTFGSGSTLFTPSGLQNSETVGTVTLAVSGSGGTAAAAVGSYTLTPSASTGGTFTAANYTITYNTGTLTVNTKTLTVTANNRSKTYGATVTFAGSEFTTVGLVNGNTVTSVTLTSGGAVATAGVSGSPYSIVPSAAVGTGLTNYNISYVNGSLTVNMAAPTSIGQANSITSNTSLSVTVPAGGVAAGNTIIVSFAMDPNAGTVSVADTKSNSYSKDVDILNSKGVRTLVFSAPVTTALVAGNTITVTYPATVSKAVSIYSVSGLVSASRVDQTQTGPGTAIAVSSGNTAATAQASELLIGAIGSESYDTTFTVGTGYTVMNSAIANDGNNTNASISIFPEYRIVSATGVYDANGTLSVSRDWAAAIVTYIIQ